MKHLFTLCIIGVIGLSYAGYSAEETDILKTTTPAVDHYNQGLVLKDTDKKKAVKEFKKAIQLDPFYIDAHREYMAIMMEQGKRDEILAEYRAKVKEHPSQMEYHYLLGRVLDDKADTLDEAIAEYKKAIAIKPDHTNDGYSFTLASVHNNLAVAYSKKGDLDQAITEWKSAAQTEPTYAKAHANLGYAYNRQGKSDEAIAAYKKAIEIDPNYVKAYTNLGVIYHKLNKFASATEALTTAVTLKPDEALAHSHLGDIYFKLNDLQQSIAHYNAFILLARTNPSLQKHVPSIKSRLEEMKDKK